MHVHFADKSVSGPLFLDNRALQSLIQMIQAECWPAVSRRHGCDVVE